MTFKTLLFLCGKQAEGFTRYLVVEMAKKKYYHLVSKDIERLSLMKSFDGVVLVGNQVGRYELPFENIGG